MSGGKAGERPLLPRESIKGEDLYMATARWRKIVVGLAVFVVLLALGAYGFYVTQMPGHSKPATPPAPIAPSGDPVLDSIRRGVEFLKVHQEADGHFSKGALDPKPAFTALVVDALARCPDRYNERDHPFFARAVQAILACRQKDGSICTPSIGMHNYCTSISIMALKATGNPAYQEVLEKAAAYLKGIQVDPEPGNPDGGGFGYSAGSRPDMSNAAQTIEALREMGIAENDPVFQNAVRFMSRCQNNAETNDQPWAGTDGGFVYRPTDRESKAGYEQGRDGKRIPKSYGLVSYAGLKAFLLAYVSKDDPRVQAAFRWVRDNWSLEENRNIGTSGLYFYYLTMAKALKAYGERYIETSDGVRHDWPRELAEKLISLQRKDGSWANENPKWMENDAVLVTAFAIRTLSICFEAMREQPAGSAGESRAAAASTGSGSK